MIHSSHLFTRYKATGAFVLHLLVWGILLGFPFLFSPTEMPRNATYMRSVMPLLFSAFIFYVNYFLLANRFLFKGQTFNFLLFNLALVVLCVWGQHLLHEWLWAPQRRSPRYEYYKNMALIRHAFSFALTAAVAVAVRIMQRWQQSEAARKMQETEQLKSTLSHLQYQIQPHFFFNSLNNIYALVDISPEKAKNAIHRLGKLMRYLLHDTNAEQVALSNEITFLKNYVDLMRLRLTDNVQVQYDFPEDTRHIQIAPLLFIPLVENSFKHGVSAKQSSFITIQMQIIDNQIVLEVNNTNFPKNEQDQGGSGIGIDNLKKRLELLYPDQYSFRQETQGDTFSSVLTINLASIGKPTSTV